jgi:hypothetical protein
VRDRDVGWLDRVGVFGDFVDSPIRARPPPPASGASLCLAGGAGGKWPMRAWWPGRCGVGRGIRPSSVPVSSRAPRLRSFLTSLPRQRSPKGVETRAAAVRRGMNLTLRLRRRRGTSWTARVVVCEHVSQVRLRRNRQIAEGHAVSTRTCVPRSGGSRRSGEPGADASPAYEAQPDHGHAQKQVQPVVGRIDRHEVGVACGVDDQAVQPENERDDAADQ